MILRGKEKIVSIIIGADFVPTKTNENLFASGDLRTLIGDDLVEVLQAADYRIFNLEMPLTNFEQCIAKCGPNLKADPQSIKAYKNASIDLFTLANNHIMDYGEEGLNATINILKQNAISYVGVGANLDEAKKPIFFNFKEKKIGVYACAENEFSIAGENSMGANPFDPLESLDHIVEAKGNCDYLIVLYHGGKEHYRYPSPNLQKRCRKIVRKGADLVLCQHSHCVGCEERYNDSVIVYGQGNFLFDITEHECWQSGMLVCIDDNFDISYIPIEKRGNLVRKSTNKNIIENFNKRSCEIQKEGFIQEEYARFASTMCDSYLLSMSAQRRFLIRRIINKLSSYKYDKKLLSKKYKKENLLAIQNFIECEAHHELLLRGIKDRINR